MNLEVLTNENFTLFAIRHYDNPHCLSMDEFNADMLHLKYIKKLITRYTETGELKERLILNHIIILSNMFEPEVLCKIIWLKMPMYLQYIKPFLVLLNLLPERLYNVDKEQIIDTTMIPMDQKVCEALKGI